MAAEPLGDAKGRQALQERVGPMERMVPEADELAWSASEWRLPEAAHSEAGWAR